MIITTIIVAVLGITCGIIYERNRWVKSFEKNKVIAVEGNLYRVTKTSENAG
jgi:hypothetical protein